MKLIKVLKDHLAWWLLVVAPRINYFCNCFWFQKQRNIIPSIVRVTIRNKPHDSTAEISNKNHTFNVYPGKRKWLGGAINPQTGIIYGIPSHALGVLAIQPPVYEESSILQNTIPLPASKQRGRFKWLRGIVVRNILYGIPAWSQHGVLKMNLQTNEVATLPLPFSPDEAGNVNYGHDADVTKWMWHGASLTEDNEFILCVPSNAQRVLQIHEETNAVIEIGPFFHGQNKWYGGILGDDGAIYGIPYTASGILRIGYPYNGSDDVRIIGSFPQNQYLWHGGVKSPHNGAIYAFPSHADQVLKIQTRASECVNASTCNEEQRFFLLDIHRQANDDRCRRYQWLGGCIGADGNIYGIPSDSTSILKIDPRTDHVTTFGHVTSQKNKWQGAVLSPSDGRVYCIPSNAEHVLQINTTNSSSNILPTLPDQANQSENGRYRLLREKLSSMKDKFQGGFLGRDGNIYCIPENAERVLKITPSTEKECARVNYL